MPRYNVKYNEKWTCFSSVSDGFITKFMDKFEYEKWRKQQYGKQGYSPLEQCNTMTIKESAFSIRLNRTHDEAMKCLLESGLPESECKRIIYDMETDYYCPIPKKNGKFECPNCHEKIEQGQTTCNNDSCRLDFVWR